MGSVSTLLKDYDSLLYIKRTKAIGLILSLVIILKFGVCHLKANSYLWGKLAGEIPLLYALQQPL